MRTQGYRPYGATAYQTGTEKSRYQFTGQEKDDTGLYYYNARYYDQDLGRFISVDPGIRLGVSLSLGETVNPYMYCENNPIKFTDPTGMFFVVDDIAVAVIMIAAASAMTASTATTIDGVQKGTISLPSSPQEVVQNVIGNAILTNPAALAIATATAVGKMVIDAIASNSMPATSSGIPEKGKDIEDYITRIAEGHALDKHDESLVDLGVDNSDDLIDLMHDVVDGDWTQHGELDKDREYYYDPEAWVLIILDPSRTDGGTVFRPGSDPDDGQRYVDEVLE